MTFWNVIIFGVKIEIVSLQVLASFIEPKKIGGSEIFSFESEHDNAKTNEALETAWIN